MFEFLDSLGKLGAAIEILFLLVIGSLIAYLTAWIFYKSKNNKLKHRMAEYQSDIDRYKLKINNLLGINQEQQNEIGRMLDLKTELDDEITKQRIVIKEMKNEIETLETKMSSKDTEIRKLIAQLRSYEGNINRLFRDVQDSDMSKKK